MRGGVGRCELRPLAPTDCRAQASMGLRGALQAEHLRPAPTEAEPSIMTPTFALPVL